ncbi:MAG TPA: response regulator transcription factor [Candidatus Baltobacteraceae bacterium]|nr:response regulator transcription factor [Candidatus Baltobacteraceae bacterium]
MTVVTNPAPTTRVLVVGSDTRVRTAITRLLSLESGIDAAATASSIERARTNAGVIIDEALLHDLKDLSIADFIAMVKSLPPAVPERARRRHLRPVCGGRDIREVLSDRELQVVRLVAEGLSNKQISLRLRLSDKTVKNHLSHILAKMNLSARTQVAVHALRTGLA